MLQVTQRGIELEKKRQKYNNRKHIQLNEKYKEIHKRAMYIKENTRKLCEKKFQKAEY